MVLGQRRPSTSPKLKIKFQNVEQKRLRTKNVRESIKNNKNILT